jgi:hypothetical protein
MSDNKYEEALRKAVKKAYESDFDSIDFNKDIRYIETDFINYPIKKKHRYNKHIALAASILVVLILSGTFGILISNDSISASKFSAEKQFVKLENQFSDTDENYKKYIDEGNIIQEIKTLKDIKKAIDFFPDLFITNNIPERFNFESLTITKCADNVYNAIYVYKSNDEQLLTVRQQSITPERSSISLVGITDEIETKEGTIYISENPFGDGGNSGSYIQNDYSINIAGKIDKEEILSILNY